MVCGDFNARFGTLSEVDDCEFPRKVVDEVLNEHEKLLD